MNEIKKRYVKIVLYFILCLKLLPGLKLGGDGVKAFFVFGVILMAAVIYEFFKIRQIRQDEYYAELARKRKEEAEKAAAERKPKWYHYEPLKFSNEVATFVEMPSGNNSKNTHEDAEWKRKEEERLRREEEERLREAEEWERLHREEEEKEEWFRREEEEWERLREEEEEFRRQQEWELWYWNYGPGSEDYDKKS